MIKTCYRGMIKDNDFLYFFLFLLIWFSFSTLYLEMRCII